MTVTSPQSYPPVLRIKYESRVMANAAIERCDEAQGITTAGNKTD
jgi:hypothetical protein